VLDNEKVSEPKSPKPPFTKLIPAMSILSVPPFTVSVPGVPVKAYVTGVAADRTSVAAVIEAFVAGVTAPVNVTDNVHAMLAKPAFDAAPVVPPKFNIPALLVPARDMTATATRSPDFKKFFIPKVSKKEKSRFAIFLFWRL